MDHRGARRRSLRSRSTLDDPCCRVRDLWTIGGGCRDRCQRLSAPDRRPTVDSNRPIPAENASRMADGCASIPARRARGRMRGMKRPTRSSSADWAKLPARVSPPDSRPTIGLAPASGRASANSSMTDSLSRASACSLPSEFFVVGAVVRRAAANRPTAAGPGSTSRPAASVDWTMPSIPARSRAATSTPICPRGCTGACSTAVVEPRCPEVLAVRVGTVLTTDGIIAMVCPRSRSGKGWKRGGWGATKCASKPCVPIVFGKPPSEQSGFHVRASAVASIESRRGDGETSCSGWVGCPRALS